MELHLCINQQHLETPPDAITVVARRNLKPASTTRIKALNTDIKEIPPN